MTSEGVDSSEFEDFDNAAVGEETDSPAINQDSAERPSTGYVDVPDPQFHEDALLEMEQTPSAVEPQPLNEAPLGSGATSGESSGYLIDGVCYPGCVTDSGGAQGWGWENDATCVASGSLAASRGGACDGGSAPTSGGFEVDGVCYPECVTDAGDSNGWGWENDATCVAAGSPIAQAGGACGGSSSGGSTGGGSSSGGTTGGGSAGGGSAIGTNPGPNAGSCPSTFICPGGAQCGCYTVPGLGARKSALLDAGAEAYMIAAAMMETETMTTDYAYGDNKSGDSFNAGVCKQNWYMMRHCHGPWKGLESWDYATSDAMNSEISLDVQVFSACRAHYGSSWWAGHRNGQSGLENPNTWDIQRFKSVMDWLHQMIGNDHLRDDVRFWVYVPAI